MRAALLRSIASSGTFARFFWCNAEARTSVGWLDRFFALRFFFSVAFLAWASSATSFFSSSSSPLFAFSYQFCMSPL